jgi:hypothetical protein
MPVHNDDPLSPLLHIHTRGNLILKFRIEMPHSLTDSQRTELVEILAN